MKIKQELGFVTQEQRIKEHNYSKLTLLLLLVVFAKRTHSNEILSENPTKSDNTGNNYSITNLLISCFPDNNETYNWDEASPLRRMQRYYEGVCGIIAVQNLLKEYYAYVSTHLLSKYTYIQ